MIVALTYVAVSILVLAVLTFVYVVEDIKGERFFLLTLRDRFDILLKKGLNRIELFMFSLTNGVVRLLLHYGAHSVLKRVLAFIRGLEGRVEELVRKNRRIAKSISTLRTKSHIDELITRKKTDEKNDEQSTNL